MESPNLVLVSSDNQKIEIDAESAQKSHLLKGLMFHEELANYFAFLSLEGYSCCHEYRYEDESRSYRELNKYYREKLDFCNQIIDIVGPLEMNGKLSYNLKKLYSSTTWRYHRYRN